VLDFEGVFVSRLEGLPERARETNSLVVVKVGHVVSEEVKDLWKYIHPVYRHLEAAEKPNPLRRPEGC
jgi:hypothetical protein